MRIGIVTTGRSDWGILEPLVDKLAITDSIDIRLIIAGNHQCPQFGKTGGSIILGLVGRPKIICESLFDSDSLVGQAQSIGSTGMLIARQLADAHLDKIVILGDRFEALAVALAAYTLGIPIVHLEGGEMTTGSLDDGYRQCIGDLATWHCAATKQAVAQLKREGKKNVYWTGALGCHDLAFVGLPGHPYKDYDYVFLYHPSRKTENPKPIVNILRAHGSVLWVGSNADAGGRELTGVSVIPTMDRSAFLSHVKSARAIVGNSSCGIIEAPTLGTPTINIGDRQKGREAARSVWQIPHSLVALDTLLTKLEGKTSYTKKPIKNPYYKSDVLERIFKICMNKT